MTAGATGAWALIRGFTSDGLPVAVAGCVSLALLVGAATAVGDMEPATRLRLAEGVTWLGALVAVTAWAGVAWRLPRWSVLVESTMWRGSSTLTYPNLAAAVLSVAALLALALQVAAPSRVRALTTFAVLAGLGSTLSRAGLGAFGAGLPVMLVLGGVRRILPQLVAPALGALVALVALVPSFSAHAQPDPLLAVAGLLVGALLAVHLGRVQKKRLVALRRSWPR